MIVDPDMPDHWKTRMLADLLGSEAVAVCTLIRLWAHCQNRRKTEFQNLKPVALKAVCRFDGDAETLDSALMECGFIERDESTLIVVGWEEHNSKMAAAWVNGKRGGRPSKSDNPEETHGKPNGNPEETHGKPNGNPEETHGKPNGNPTGDSGNPQETGRKEGVGMGRKEEGDKPRKRATQIPDGFPGQPEMDWAKANHPAVDADHEATQFREYAKANERKQKDWSASWRMWIGKAAKWNQKPTPQRRAIDDPLRGIE